MIDLTKPIREKSTHNAARVLATDMPGEYPIVIACTSSDGKNWYADSYRFNDADDGYENIPPEPRKVTVWAVWAESDLVTCYLSERDARQCAQTYKWRVGKPVEIVEEYP